MLTFCAQWRLASTSFVFLGAALMFVPGVRSSVSAQFRQVACCVLPQSPTKLVAQEGSGEGQVSPLSVASSLFTTRLLFSLGGSKGKSERSPLS